MLNCKESIDLLLSYLDGELPENEARALEEHLSLCPPCIEFVRGYQQTPGLCRKALARKMPEELAGKLNDFLRARIKQ